MGSELGGEKGLRSDSKRCTLFRVHLVSLAIPRTAQSCVRTARNDAGSCGRHSNDDATSA